ncbi:hypothetical protein WA577_007740, partial [Blastocystis sp. JDR]
MDEGDRENGLFGSDGKKMAYCSQFSQCPDSSQRTLTLNNDSGIEKSLDIRVLTQNDFCTPGFTEELHSQLFDSLKDSTENCGVFGETPQKPRTASSRSFFKRKAGYDVSHSDMKKQCLFPSQQQTQPLTSATLPMPDSNPYLSLPPEKEAELDALLKKRDFVVFDANQLSRYQKDFKELDLLGKGISSVVTLCKHRIDGCYYAVKQISLDDTVERRAGVLKRIKKEVKLLSVMSDAPNIIRYFGSWMEDSTFYIQLEYGFYGNLSHYISMHALNEEDIKVVLAQIGSALLWMHNRGYAHMDVKPENILILSVKLWQLKLSDFGLSFRVKDEAVNEGDVRYLPGEIITAATATKADVFSLGASVLELFASPAEAKKPDFFCTIREGKIPSCCKPSPHMRVILQGMINSNVEARWSMQQVVSHKYLSSLL